MKDVPGGVYELHDLRDAQERGLTLSWVHDLAPLTGLITRAGPP